MDQRRRQLLLDTANHFSEGTPAINHEWLVKNEINIDEMGQLCEQLGGIIRGFANAPKELRTLILICSAADDPDQAQMMVARLTESMALETVIERLKKV